MPHTPKKNPAQRGYIDEKIGNFNVRNTLASHKPLPAQSVPSFYTTYHEEKYDGGF